MNESSTLATREGHYELRFTGLFGRGRGYVFPCDVQGHVVLDELSDRSRCNYLYARAVVGAELSIPFVAVVV